MEKKYYTSDYVVQEYGEISQTLTELKSTKDFLMKMFGDGVKDTILLIDGKVAELEAKSTEKYPDGVYCLTFSYLGHKKGTLIKRIQDDGCDKCFCNHAPCYAINSKYGCHIRKEKGETNGPNGILINEGCFAIYQEGK